jgi:hypothetical protein
LRLTLARATLEASFVAAWLNEPRISYEDRVKTGMCERLYSAAEVAKLGIKADAEETLAEYVADAFSFGWEPSFDDDGKPSVDGTSWPSIPEGITRLLARGRGGNPGPLLWSRLSAVTHSLWWGLEWALDLSRVQPVGPGRATVSIGTESVGARSAARAESRAPDGSWSRAELARRGVCVGLGARVGGHAGLREPCVEWFAAGVGSGAIDDAVSAAAGERVGQVCDRAPDGDRRRAGRVAT